jgi:hypothetical protein
MQIIFGIVILLFAASGLVVYLDRNQVSMEPLTPSDLAASPAAAPTVFSETGMIIVEEEDESQGVAWLVYETPNRPIATKKLVFPNVRTCTVEGGDLPCATDVREGRLPVQDGERVRVEGEVRGEQVDVTHITWL